MTQPAVAELDLVANPVTDRVKDSIRKKVKGLKEFYQPKKI